MTEANENRLLNFFTPLRFGILLALLIFATFPQVVSGLQTFVIRDFGFFSYPNAVFQRECFWRGELPFWNPYNECGVPFLAQWNTMPLYPPSLIYLLLPLQWSLSFFCLLHLWFAGMGMFFLARHWTENNFAAAFAGTAFSFNGLTLNLLMWPSHIATFSWMPWVVLAVEMAWRDGGRKIFLAAFAGAMQMLAGGPETIFFTWLLLAVLWLRDFLRGKAPRGKMFFRFPLVILMVAALAAIQLLPFLDLAAHSERQTGYADLRWSMPASGWANFFVPMAFGSQAMGIFFQNGQNWTSSYFLGIGGLLLAILAVRHWKQPRVPLLVIAAIVAVIFALGENTPVYPALRKIFPALSFITYPIKYVLLLTFIAPLLAAFTLAEIQKKPAARQIVLTAIIFFALIIGILFWTARADAENHAVFINGLARIIFLLATSALLFVFTKESKSIFKKIIPLALVLLAWLDVLTHEPTQNPTAPATIYAPNLAREKLQLRPQPELGKSRAMLLPSVFLRFVHTAIRNPQNNFLVGRVGGEADCNLLDEIPKVDGFYSVLPREWSEVRLLLYGTPNANYPAVEDFLGVSQITATNDIYQWQSRPNFFPLVTAGQKPVFVERYTLDTPLSRPDFDGRKIVFLLEQTKSFVTVSNQTSARILDSNFKTRSVDIEAEADEPSLVVIAQTYYHNWQAFVDGNPTPLLQANHAFQAVQISAGKHRIQLIYEDRAFEIGAVISVIALCGCLGALFFFRKKFEKS